MPDIVPIMSSTEPDLTARTRMTAAQRAGMEKLGLRMPEDLWSHYPRRHEDRRHSEDFPDDATCAPVAIDACIFTVNARHYGRARSLCEVVLVPAARPDADTRITARWFNLPWLHKSLHAGDRMFAYGKVKRVKDRLFLDHPEIEIVEAGDSPGLHSGRLTPIYPLTAGIKQKFLRGLIHKVVMEDGPTRPDLPPMLPPSLAGKAEIHLGTPWLDTFTVRRQLHFPESTAQLEAARKQWALAEFFRLQLAVAIRRRLVLGTPTLPRCGRGALLAAWAKALPFDLTTAQKQAIRAIRADLKLPRPMHRLLQGDVGSGKTAVAMAAITLAVESGCQAAVMAPTQILAEQHFLTFSRLLGPLGLHVALRTGARGESSEGDVPRRPDLIVGTHALLFDGVNDLLHDVGLVIIDEQHKFGVAQRARLLDRTPRPHVLVMTATPIPRTLTMTLYGDLDITILDELPPGRGEILTAVRTAPKTDKVAAFLRDHLAAGRQAYIVHPLVEESAKQDAKAANTGFAEWQARLPDFRFALLTGRTPAAEKDTIMADFRAGSIHVLATTSVIEVGVDVPNATVMIIHDANRFGLAQLHQLRGRVGRGCHKSYCILLVGKDDDGQSSRLDILANSRDGFVIAEEDMRQRGPGDVLGTAQSGLPGLSAPSIELLTDTRWIAAARAMADALLDEDPLLDHPDNMPWKPAMPPATTPLVG